MRHHRQAAGQQWHLDIWSWLVCVPERVAVCVRCVCGYSCNVTVCTVWLWAVCTCLGSFNDPHLKSLPLPPASLSGAIRTPPRDDRALGEARCGPQRCHSGQEPLSSLFLLVVALCSLSQMWPWALATLHSVLALDSDSTHAPSSSSISATLAAG